MAGSVLSMLTPLTVAEAELPALSVAVPVTNWPAPSDETVVFGVTAATPDNTSLAVKLTMTSLLFQPLALAPGVREPLILGFVLSMLMLLILVKADVLPALSVAVPL